MSFALLGAFLEVRSQDIRVFSHATAQSCAFLESPDRAPEGTLHSIGLRVQHRRRRIGVAHPASIPHQLTLGKLPERSTTIRTRESCRRSKFFRTCFREQIFLR